jgi:rhodanese-related sulfurtransferase
MRTKIIPFIISLILLTTPLVLAETNNFILSHEPLEHSNEYLGPSLSFDPTSHDFGDVYEGAIKSTVFNVWNSGCCQLIFKIYDPYNWVSVCPSGGSSTDDIVPITVTINTEGLAAGPYHCPILITSNSGEGTFQVDINVIKASTPVLFFYPSSINFGEVIMRSTAVKSFEIWNVGTDTLIYTLSENCQWLAISPSGGSSTGTHNSITISINTTNLNYGQYSYDVNIDSNGGKGTLTVLVKVVEAKYPVLAFSPTRYDFGEILKGDTTQTFFEIWNAGGRQLQFYLIENYDWVTVTPSEGYSNGEHVNISVVINTSALSLRLYNCMILINSNGESDSFLFTVTVTDEINTPPTIPVVNGIKSGTEGQLSKYNCVSTDPNSDKIYYNFSWGDGSFSSWLGPFDSGQQCTASHIWAEKGVFEIEVQAMDSNTTHTKSDWSEPYMIGIDCYLNISVNEAWMLVQDISNGIQIPIDIRPLQFFDTEHIDTQSSVEKTRWFGEKLLTKIVPLTFFEVLYIDEDVILYSQNGEDSNLMAQVLVDHGFSSTVYNMIGGIDAWKNAGLPTIKG